MKVIEADRDYGNLCFLEYDVFRNVKSPYLMSANEILCQGTDIAIVMALADCDLLTYIEQGVSLETKSIVCIRSQEV